MQRFAPSPPCPDRCTTLPRGVKRPFHGIKCRIGDANRLTTTNQPSAAGERADAAVAVANLKHGGDRKSDQGAPVPLSGVSIGEAADLFGVSKRLVQDASVDRCEIAPRRRIYKQRHIHNDRPKLLLRFPACRSRRRNLGTSHHL
jgi:hypothetical protein